eukprot:c55395_g1_i1 orf=87-257(+)
MFLALQATFIIEVELVEQSLDLKLVSIWLLHKLVMPYVFNIFNMYTLDLNGAPLIQ